VEAELIRLRNCLNDDQREALLRLMRSIVEENEDLGPVYTHQSDPQAHKPSDSSVSQNV